MANIKESRNGSLAKNGKLNEVIRYLNGLLNMTVREGSNAETPRLISAENHSILITTQADTELPFTVSISDDGLTVASGYYLTVNEPVFIAASDASAGSFAYIRLQHSSTGVLVSTDPFSTFITSTALDPDELDSTDSFIEYSNCLLAAVVSDEVQQYRSGNVTLIHTTVNGKVCLWPYFEGGSA